MSRSTVPPSRRASLAALLVVTAVIAASAAICQVWMRLRSIQYGYRISEATKQQVELVEVNRRLRLEVALLSSPQHISRVVAEQGLRPPTPEQVRRLHRRDSSNPSTPGKRTLARVGP